MPRIKKSGNVLYELKEVSMEAVIEYQKHEIGKPYIIKIKAPSEAEKFIDDHKHYTKSNINVCYAAPRNKKTSRNWYETQLCVSSEVRKQEGYPYKGIPFYVVTDDGYGFMAHTTSANNKQFAAVGDELILGKWIKERMVKEGLITPVSNTSEDNEGKGMITREMLCQYGCNAIAFQKTDLIIPDPIQPLNHYEIWTLKLVKIDE